MIINGTVVTMNRQHQIIEDGAVLIEGERIVEVGKSDTLKKHFSSDVVLDAKDKVVLPGFVNVHTHLPSLFVRGVYGVVTEGLFKILFPIKRYIEPKQMHTFGLASCLEAINFGSTCVVETYNYIEEFAKAADETGLRAVVGEQVADVNYDKLKDGVYEYLPDQGSEMLDRGVRLIENWEEDSRIKTIIAPLAPDMCTPETYIASKEAAEKYDKRVTTHMAQSNREIKQVWKLYGKTPTQHLRDIGVVNEKLSSAHCIYLNNEDTEIITDADMGILHCPRPYLLNGVTTPLSSWLNKGIRVGLGTDNVHHDMFQTMRAALYASRLRSRILEESSSRSLGIMELLELATIKGAEIFGLEDEIGSIEKGKKADIITINIKNPHISPTADLLSSLVLYANGNDIDDVIVEGNMLKRNGKILFEEWKEIITNAQNVGSQMWSGFWKDKPELYDVWKKFLAWS
jgi:5-methylthioadenosine/S-adenosylhomocysteine deaminase